MMTESIDFMDIVTTLHYKQTSTHIGNNGHIKRTAYSNPA